MIVYTEAAGCTNVCRHCSVGGHSPIGDFYTLDELRGLRNEWGRLIIYYEPTAYSDFPEVYDESIAVEHGGWLVSNGYGLAKREDHAKILDKLHVMGIHTIAFTLHGLEKHHDWFVCRTGAFADIMLATRRVKSAGLQPNWQIYIDRKGIGDVEALVKMAENECGLLPQISIPAHRVGGRLWHYEALRPTLKDVQEWQIHELVDDPKRNYLRDPEELTTRAWIEKWKKDPSSDEFKHIFEPRSWPPQRAYEYLTLLIRRNRKVYLDPMCTSPIYLGNLSKGKEVLLSKVSEISPPAYINITPDDVKVVAKELDQLHPYGMSVRYLEISKAIRQRKTPTYPSCT